MKIMVKKKGQEKKNKILYRIQQSIVSKFQNHCNYVRTKKIDDFINFVRRGSAKKIQRQWRLSICNPEYRLRQSRIRKEFDDLKISF